MHQLESGGMNRIAAKIAEKVSVFFKDENMDASSSEQEAEDHSGRAAADNTAICLQSGRISLIRHRCLPNPLLWQAGICSATRRLNSVSVSPFEFI